MLPSVIVPVYREETNDSEFLRRLRPVLAAITTDYQVIFALDPSPDRTEAITLEHRAQDERIKLLRFTHRFGPPMAALADHQYASGDVAAVMDLDLQDPPELLTEMVAKWREGFEVVLPQGRSRAGEPWLKKLVAAIGHRVINKIADVRIPPNNGDFRLISHRVGDKLLRLKECLGFLGGMVSLVGFGQCLIPLDRPPRRTGGIHYNRFPGSLRIGFNGIVCCSNYALTLATKLDFVVAGFSFLFSLVYLLFKLMGWPVVWGNPTLVILISFLGGVQLISVGILGEYIGCIYAEVRARPKFIVDRAERFQHH